MSDTLSSVSDDVLYQLGDISEAVWTAAEVKVYIKEAYNLLIRLTLPLWTYAYLNDTVNVALADLPTDCLKVDRVTWNWKRIPPLSARELRSIDTRYMLNTGPVRAYSLGQDGIGKLRKWLVPAATATAGQDIDNTRIEYYARGSALSADASTFELPARCIKYIMFYALAQAYGRKGKGQSPTLSEHFMGRFAVGVERLLNRKRLANSQRVGRFGGATPTRSTLPSPVLPWNFGKVVRYR